MDARVQQPLGVRQAEFALKFNLTLEQYLQVVQSCTMSEVIVVLELMKAKNPKSSYRKRLQSQVRRWLDNRLYSKPLMPSQFKELTPNYSITWELPK